MLLFHHTSIVTQKIHGIVKYPNHINEHPPLSTVCFLHFHFMRKRIFITFTTSVHFLIFPFDRSTYTKSHFFITLKISTHWLRSTTHLWTQYFAHWDWSLTLVQLSTFGTWSTFEVLRNGTAHVLHAFEHTITH